MHMNSAKLDRSSDQNLMISSLSMIYTERYGGAEPAEEPIMGNSGYTLAK